MRTRAETIHAILRELNSPKYTTDILNDIVITTVVERERSYVISFQTRAFVEEGNEMKMIIGHGPVVIHKNLDRYAFVATFADQDQRVAEAESWIETSGETGARSVVDFGDLPGSDPNIGRNA